MTEQNLFDPETALAGSVDVCIQEYHRHCLRSNPQVKNIHHKRTTSFREGRKFTDEQVRSFRAACVAKDETSSKVSYQSLARLHKIPSAYSVTLRRDWTMRPTAIPDVELIEKFKEKLTVGETQVRYIKAKNKADNIEPKDIRAIKRARKALQWSVLLKFFKRSFGQYPKDQISGLVMLEELYAKKCMVRETAVEGVQLVQDNLPGFTALQEESSDE